MKTEINIENKAKFFAQYWHRPYIYNNNFGTFKDKVGSYHFGTHVGYESCSLQLKPLSSITPEEQGFITSSKITNDDRLIVGNKIGNYFYGDVYITDYLRCKGYALPWMGLSVEEMVQAGWIKLQGQ